MDTRESGNNGDDDRGITAETLFTDFTAVEQPNAGPMPLGDAVDWEHKSLEVALLWHGELHDVRHYVQPARVTIGEHAENDFRVTHTAVPSATFPLVQMSAAGPRVHWTAGMLVGLQDAQGRVADQAALNASGSAELDARHDVAEGGAHYSYRLGLHDRLALQFGTLTFVVQYVSPAPVLVDTLSRRLDVAYLAALGGAALMHAVVFAMLVGAASESPTETAAAMTSPAHVARLVLKDFKRPERIMAAAASKGGGRHKEREGAFGRPEAEKKAAAPSRRGAPRTEPSKHERERKVALETGLLKALSGGRVAALSDVLGPGGLGTGLNKALGGLRGTAGTARGTAGLGSRHAGAGGGGKSLGIGGLVESSSFGAGGLGNVDLQGNGTGSSVVLPGRITTAGCLTEGVVARALKRVEAQARYCYEAELQREPDLSGKVITNINIAASGAVTAVRILTSSLSSPNVENCLIRVLGRVHFPPCAGGGDAEANYPWLFKPTAN